MFLPAAFFRQCQDGLDDSLEGFGEEEETRRGED
jgi:hypothetical protein